MVKSTATTASASAAAAAAAATDLADALALERRHVVRLSRVVLLLVSAEVDLLSDVLHPDVGLLRRIHDTRCVVGSEGRPTVIRRCMRVCAGGGGNKAPHVRASVWR